MDDVRYYELKFLTALASGKIPYFCHFSPEQTGAFSPGLAMYEEMVAVLIEDGLVEFDNRDLQLMVAKLQGRLSPAAPCPITLPPPFWQNPAQGIRDSLLGRPSRQLRISYRGLRRIEELREILRRDRILEHFGVLLDMRYFVQDLELALARGTDTAVSVIYADMDNFKNVNTQHGHAGGDVVMKAYLEVIRDCVGQSGTAYRGRGDETACILVGQGHDQATAIAEKMREQIAKMHCEHNGQVLPKVTASIGVASTPPENRTSDVETLADARQQKAKDAGKNRVVSK